MWHHRLEESLYCICFIDGDDGVVFITGKANGRLPAFQYFTDKIIWQEKDDETELCVQELFDNASSFANEYTIARAQIIRALGGVPDLPAFYYIHEIILVTPQVGELVL